MKENISPYRNLETMGVLCAAALVFGLVLKIQALLYVALALLLTGLFVKKLAALITRIWLRFAEVLGSINTRIILSVIFFVILTPIALVYRMIHGDFMGLKRREKAVTYFSEREHAYVPGDLTNPW
jgi:hypothetical protein